MHTLALALAVVACLHVQQYTDLQAHHGLRWDAVEEADHYVILGRQVGTATWQRAGVTRDTFWSPVRGVELEIPEGIEVEFAVRAEAADDTPVDAPEGDATIVGVRWPAVCYASDRQGICACFAACEEAP